MPEHGPINEYRITEHAWTKMRRRHITEAEISRVLSMPQQTETVRRGRVSYQSRVEDRTSGRVYLLRVFVDVDRQPAAVVTVYRTSRIDKYWRNES